jgi:hypothetical protein
MPVPLVVTIDTVEDLSRILTLKRIIARRASEELLNIAGDKVLQGNSNPSVEDTLQFIKEETELLRKYANYPSLTEWNLMPELHAGSKWGSTFGVTILVGEMILENMRQQHPGLPVGALQKVLMTVLGELNKPTAAYLIDSVQRFTKFNLERQDGRPLSDDERSMFVRQILGHILEDLITIMEKYDLVEGKEAGVALTPLGHRVLLHMKDATDFVTVLSAAHTRLQSEKPNLTSASE